MDNTQKIGHKNPNIEENASKVDGTYMQNDISYRRINCANESIVSHHNSDVDLMLRQLKLNVEKVKQQDKNDMNSNFEEINPKT